MAAPVQQAGIRTSQPIAVNRHSQHYQQQQHHRQQQHQPHHQQPQQQQPCAQYQPPHYQHHSSVAHNVDDDSTFDAADLRSLAMLSLVDDDDESDSALPSRSLIASQHAALLEQQQQQQRRHYQHHQQRQSGASDTVEPLSPPMTALHALHSQLLGHSLLPPLPTSTDDSVNKAVLDDEKQRVSPSPSRRLSAVSPWTSGGTTAASSLSAKSAVSIPFSASFHPSPSLRGVSPSSTRTTSPLPAGASLQLLPSSSSPPRTVWAERAASFSAVGLPSSVVSTSRSSSFAATNSPFLSHSPFSSSPFSPFTVSALPSTPFELPRAALPPTSPALSSASSRSSASSATPPQQKQPHSAAAGGQHNPAAVHSGGSAGQQSSSIELQLLDEAEEDTSQQREQQREQRQQQQQQYYQPQPQSQPQPQRLFPSSVSVAGSSPTGAAKYFSALQQHDVQPYSHRPLTASASSPSSPWLSASSLHIIDDSSAATGPSSLSSLTSPHHRPLPLR